jgi:hypothetical protein
VARDGRPGKLTPGGGTTVDPPPAPAFAPTRPDPSVIEEIRPHVGRDIAVGRLFDTDGRPLTPIVGPGDTGAAEGLAEPRRSMRFVHHVESNATAYMRRNGVREAVLYMNMQPCRGGDGCAENLNATLPVGYRLRVYQVYPSGSVRVSDFPGTGEGIADE